MFPIILFAQFSLADFNWLKSEGKIPADFKKAMDSPSDMTQWTLHGLFAQGDVIYGTEVNQYLDNIIDRLLTEHPELRNEIRCYAVRSTEVNAYAMPNGVIFVNLGLIAQSSNEGEIAFVLAHEIAHYVKKHHRQKKEYKRDKTNETIDDFLKIHNYSREIEMEADRFAIEHYYTNSAYSYAALEGVFDMLQYGYLPFDEMPFSRTFVEEEFYHFPDSYFLDNLNPIRSRDDYVDTLSTHPNIKRRRENVENIIRNLDNNGRELFVQSEAKFKQIREICRFECINVFLVDHEYDNALYNIYFLRKNNPEHSFLDIALAMAYYGLCAHKLQSDYTDVMENYRNIEGEKQQMHHIFTKLTRQELNVLALRNIWIIHKKYPENVFVQGLLEDMASELIVRNKMEYTDFSDYAQHVNIEEIKIEEEPADTTATAGTRYQRIRKTTRGKVVPTEKFKTVNYMLVDLKANPDFVDYMDQLTKKIEDKAILQSLTQSKTYAPVNGIAVMNPYYWRGIKVMKNTSDEKIEEHVKKVENQARALDKTVEYSLKDLKFDYHYYTNENMLKFDTENYNNYTQIQLWRSEYFSAGKTEMRLYQCRNSEQITETLGYENAAFIYVYSAPAKFAAYDKFEKILLYAPFQYTILPMSVFNFLLPRYQTYITVNTVDLRDGKTIRSASVIRTGDMTQSYINYFIYDSFYNLKKGK
ncbi:MAG: M48 family metallopeptidase [Bacteroidales bacterium]|nr:M48 family metallopeptidase [Bacteroidales bacterium]